MKNLTVRLFVSGCVLASLSAHAGAADLLFGEVQPGLISSPAQKNTYAFSGKAGEVIDFTMVTTSGTLVPQLQLYNSDGTLIASAHAGEPFGCGGKTLEMNQIRLTTPGTYYLDVSDCSDTNAGDYNLYAQSTNDPVKAIKLPIASVRSDNITLAAQSVTYTFSANANDVFDFTMVTTSGSFVPKIRLYNPDGTLNSSNNAGAPFGCGGTTLEMNTVMLPKTGTYTVLIGDCSDTDTGEYDVYTQRTDRPAGVALLFGQVQSGSITAETQSNTFSFSAKANDVVNFTMVTTSGNVVPKVRLYNPDGTLNASNNAGAPFGCGGTTLEMNGITLPNTGTYTLLAGDCSDTKTGKYDLYAQRTNNPSRAVILNMAQRQTNLIGSIAQSNTFVFAGLANEVVDFTMFTTNGSLVPKMALYNPDGKLNASNNAAAPFGCGGTTLEMNGITLPKTGTYTLLVADCSDINTGNYAIYTQSTNDPFAPAPLVWGHVQGGTVKSVVQSNTYTFGGIAKNVVDFTVVTTNGTLVPKIRLYNPDGTLNAANNAGAPFGCGGNTVQLNSVTLPQNGDYTVLIDDCSDTNTGTYNLSSQCFGTCRAMPAITWATPAPITFCTELSSKELDASANVAGSLGYSPGSGTVLSLGPHILSTTFTPSNTAYSNARDFVQLTVAQAPTSTALASSLNPSIFSETVSFTATVSSSCGTPPGTVTFKNGSLILATITLIGGEARFSIAGLAAGTHSIKAVYNGSTDFLTSSSTLTQTVKKAASSTSLASSLNPSKFGESVTFTATVRSGGTPSGTVIFKNGSSILGTGTLSSGKAKFTTTTLSKGTHSITAVYGGSADFLSSTSPVLTQVVN